MLSWLPICFCHFHSHLQILLSLLLPAKGMTFTHSSAQQAMYSYFFSQPSLFVCFWDDKEPLQFTAPRAHTDIPQPHCSCPQCSSALPSAILPLCLSHISHRSSTVFSSPSALTFNLSGVRVSLHVRQHSRSTEGQGRALLQKSSAAWNAGPILARGFSSPKPGLRTEAAVRTALCWDTTICLCQLWILWMEGIYNPEEAAHMQDAAPGDAEVKRGEKKGCTIKERQRHEHKHLLPGGGSQRKSLELCRRGEWRKSSWLSQPWSQRGAGRQNSPKWAAVGAKES